MTTAKATKAIERDFGRLNYRGCVAATKLISSAYTARAEATHFVAHEALRRARAANKVARSAIAALS